jgi:hypothetical protein
VAALPVAVNRQITNIANTTWYQAVMAWYYTVIATMNHGNKPMLFVKCKIITKKTNMQVFSRFSFLK